MQYDDRHDWRTVGAQPGEGESGRPAQGKWEQVDHEGRTGIYKKKGVSAYLEVKTALAKDGVC